MPAKWTLSISSHPDAHTVCDGEFDGLLLIGLERIYTEFIMCNAPIVNRAIETPKRTLFVTIHRNHPQMAFIRCNEQHRDGSVCICDEFEVAQRSIVDGSHDAPILSRRSSSADSIGQIRTESTSVCSRINRSHAIICASLWLAILCEFAYVIAVIVIVVIVYVALRIQI